MNENNVQTTKKKRGANATDKQHLFLIEYLKKNSRTLASKQTQAYTLKDSQRDWENLANILNSMPGANKTWQRWRKAWQDLRSRTKSKQAKNRRVAGGTGGGPFTEDSMSTVEEGVMDMIKTVSVEGHPIDESTVDFSLTRAFPESELIRNNDEEIAFVTRSPIHTEQYPTIAQVNKNTFLDENLMDDTVGSERIESNNTKTSSCKPVTTSKTTKKKMTKKFANLVHSAEAAAAYEKYLKAKLQIKQQYCQDKILHFKTVETLKKEKNETLQAIADGLLALLQQRSVI